MNIDRINALTNEAEVRAYLKEVGKLYGAMGLLQCVTSLLAVSEEVALRAGWALEVYYEQKKAEGAAIPPPPEWSWPYMRHSDGPEYGCRHGIGHSSGVHGCDGCCVDPAFPGKKK